MKSSTVTKITSIKSLVLFSLVLIFGVIFLFFSIKMVLTPIPENYIETEATISKIEITLPDFIDSDFNYNDESQYNHNVFINYSFNGQNFTNVAYDSYNSSMQENDKITIFVNPENPSEYISNKSGDFIYVIIGSVVSVIGIAGLIYSIKSLKNSKKGSDE